MSVMPDEIWAWALPHGTSRPTSGRWAAGGSGNSEWERRYIEAESLPEGWEAVWRYEHIEAQDAEIARLRRIIEEARVMAAKLPMHAGDELVRLLESRIDE